MKTSLKGIAVTAFLLFSHVTHAGYQPNQADFPMPPATAADCLADRHWELVPTARCVCNGDLGHIPVSNDQPTACHPPPPTLSVYRSPTSAVTGSGYSVSWTATDSWVVNYACTGASPSSGVAGQAPQNGGTSASWNGTGARTPMTGGYSGTYGAIGSTSCTWSATGLGGTTSVGDGFTVYCPPPPPDTDTMTYSIDPLTCAVTGTPVPVSPTSIPSGGGSSSTVPVTPSPTPTPSNSVTQTCADYGAYGSGYITMVNGVVVAQGGTCSANTPCPAGQTGGPIVNTIDVASGMTSQSGSCQTPTSTSTIPTPTPTPSCLTMGMQGTYPDCGLCTNGSTDYPTCTPPPPPVTVTLTTETQDLPCTAPLVGTAGKQSRTCAYYYNGTSICDPWLTTVQSVCNPLVPDPPVSLALVTSTCRGATIQNNAIQVPGSQISLYVGNVSLSSDPASQMLIYTTYTTAADAANGAPNAAAIIWNFHGPFPSNVGCDGI